MSCQKFGPIAKCKDSIHCTGTITIKTIQMNIAVTRKLKICYSHYQKSRRRHPVINLKGHYLEKFGFTVGGYVDLTVSQDKIVIQRRTQN